MGSKKQIIAIVLLTVLLGGGAVGYSWQAGQARVSTFPGAGYVHIADPEQEAKQLSFQSGTAWHMGLSDTVSFVDAQGVAQKVSAESFTHYENRSLSALSRGVVVDLNDLDTAQMTNYYAMAPTVTFASTGNGYTLENSATELTLNDFLWKISEDKYMLVSQGMELNLSEEDAREVGDYVEITYVDKGVIQLQTVDNVWQTVSDVCFVNLDNGNVVDLALRNVRNEDGEVLMDFSKMVVDSNSNIEVIPLTEELKNVKESVIPHFEITARNGENGENGAAGAVGAPGEAGEAGDPGENGESGEDGQQGAPGEAGANGAAGASGTNGAAGAPGKPGEPGVDGKEPPAAITTEVLSLPEFTLKDWTPAATGCQGTIMVQDKGRMLVPNGTQDKDGNALNARVYVVDALTGVAVGTNIATTSYTFDSTAGEGYPFQFTGLAPDREYILVVEAPLDTKTGSKGAYLRTFINKSFFTDSVGVYLEAEPSEFKEEGGELKPAVNLSVHTQEYAAGTVSKATVYLFASETVAAGETLQSLSNNSTTILHQVEVTIDRATGESGTICLSQDTLNGGNLASNTTYYARVVATVNGTNMLPAQVLPLTTLKQRATLKTPIITANRNNWGFDLTAGGVLDPDSGITGYQWEIIPASYKDKPEECPADVKKTVKADLANSVTVPLDNDVLRPEEEYVVRLVAQFYDNEKSYSIASEWSNAAKVMGGELPLVTFTPTDAASADKEDVNQLNTDSGYYDQIVGTINVLTTGKSARLLLDEEHPAKVTVYAAGYYRKELPVYLRDPEHTDLPLGVTPSSDNFLLGYVETDGTVRILVDEGKLEELQKADANDGKDPTPQSVNSLFPDMAYRLIVSGDLSNSKDVSQKVETNITVGACVVETEKLQWTGVSLTYDDDESSDRVHIAQSKLRLFTQPLNQAGTDIEQVDEELLERQKKTLSSVTIKALKSTSSTTDDYNALTLTSDNYVSQLSDPELGVTIPEGVKSLGDLMSAGLPLSAKMFGSKYVEEIKNAGAAIIQVSMVRDYTCLLQNQQSWTYQNTADGPKFPDPNRFPLACGLKPEGEADRVMAELVSATEDTITFTIPLNPMPEPIPDAGQGFSRVEGKDNNRDGSFDTFELEPNYGNTSELAKYITYYVFDRPDYQEVDYNDIQGGWTFDPEYDPTWEGATAENLDQFWAEEAVSGHPEYPVRGPRYKTPVTAVTSGGPGGELKGTWLAKLRIPVPTQGTSAHQIPKVNFIAMTAENYYQEVAERQNSTPEAAGLDRHNKAMRALEAGEMVVDPYQSGTNTWNMFYPNGSTEPTTGHQFIFAWTLEWEQPDANGNPYKKYYPFEMDGFRGSSMTDYINLIPHSNVQDVPHPEPEVFAMPWKQDVSDMNTDTTRVIQWDLTINDPAGAVVAANPDDEDRTAYLYEMQSSSNAWKLYVKDSTVTNQTRTEVKVHEQSRAKDSVHGPKYRDWLTYQVERDRADIYVEKNGRDNHQVGLMLQRYTNRYLQKSKSPFDSDYLFDPGGTGDTDGNPDTTNGYSDSTVKASTINGGRSIPYYFHAFTFTFSESDYDRYAEHKSPNPGNGIEVTIDRDDWGLLGDGTAGPLPGYEQNQYNVTVTGDNLDQVNGIRLKFGDGPDAVVLDKYLNGYKVDKANEMRPLSFRVHIDRELSAVSGEVPISAYVLYENGQEGYGYLEESKPTLGAPYLHPMSLRDSRNGRWNWTYLRFSSSGGTATVSDSPANTTERYPRMGSMFQIVWQDGGSNRVTYDQYDKGKGWPYGIGLIPTRAQTMSDLSQFVRNHGVSVETLSFDNISGVTTGVLKTNGWKGSGSIKTPRVLKEYPVESVIGTAVVDGKINVPPIRPFIVYNNVDSESYANYMDIWFSVNQRMGSNLYFTLEKDFNKDKNGSEYSLLAYEVGKTGHKEWVDKGKSLGESNEENVNRLVDQNIFYQFSSYNPAYNTANKQVMLKLLNLEPDRTYYRLRAYYKDTDGKYKLLKEVNRDTGENKEKNNDYTEKTSDAPYVEMEATYLPVDYREKRLSIFAEVQHLDHYYYTLELQDSQGNFLTYLSCYFNYAPIVGSQGGVFNVGQAFGDLNVLPFSDTITRSGLVTDPTKLIHLTYGEEYHVVMKAYNEATGPAYADKGGSVQDDLLANKYEGIKDCPFTVKDTLDGLSLYGKYDLQRGSGGTTSTVTFTRSPAKESRRIWQDKLAPVIIWEHNGTYTDITSQVQNAGVVGFNSGDIKLDVSKYTKGDQFYCFMYGIRETQTDTGGLPNRDYPYDREYILGSLANVLAETPLNISKLQGFTEPVEGVGDRVMLASSVVTHKGEETNAGVVSVNWYPGEPNNVLVTLTDSVERSAIKTVVWDIRAMFVSENGSNLHDDGDIDLQSALSGDSFSISPKFTFPDDAKNITYTVTLTFKNGEGQSVGLSASENDNAVVQDNTLSCQLQPRDARASTFSSMLRSIRDFFAAPFRKED